jgi:hypothetical protein
MNYFGRASMPAGGTLMSAFSFLGRDRDREAELAAHIRREHRRGRPLAVILGDPYVQRRGGRGVLREVLRRPQLIRALGRDVADAIAGEQAEVGRPARTNGRTSQ